MKCHINVELCSSVTSIKYILKYTHKGTDRAVYNLEDPNVNEISDYENNRYTKIATYLYISSNLKLHMHKMFFCLDVRHFLFTIFTDT